MGWLCSAECEGPAVRGAGAALGGPGAEAGAGEDARRSVLPPLLCRMRGGQRQLRAVPHMLLRLLRPLLRRMAPRHAGEALPPPGLDCVMSENYCPELSKGVEIGSMSVCYKCED